MELLLDKTNFELNSRTRGSAFFVHIDDEENGLEYSIDCSFKENNFQGESVNPSLSINPIETNAKNIQELVGKSFTVDTIEEADEREDTFYIFEHEPLERYELKILEIKNDRAHIRCTGIAVVDGYADPYTTAEFKIDCWLPIVTNIKDWAKFGL